MNRKPAKKKAAAKAPPARKAKSRAALTETPPARKGKAAKKAAQPSGQAEPRVVAPLPAPAEPPPVAPSKGGRPIGWRKLTKQEAMDAINAKEGFIYHAAEHLGCHYETLARMIAEHADVKRLVDEWKGRFLDTAEMKLKENVNKGDMTAIKVALMGTKEGRARGYSQQIDVKDSRTIPDLKLLPTEVLMALRNAKTDDQFAEILKGVD